MTSKLIMKSILTIILTVVCSSWALGATEPKSSAPKPPCCREGLPPGKYSEKSLYSLKSVWTSDVGRDVKLEVLRGRPQVIALFFTNCEHSCPLIVEEMKAIDNALPHEVRGNVDFLLVSIDPKRDTPEALGNFRAKHGLPTERWTLLRGSDEATRDLAAMVGFKYQPGSPTQFAELAPSTGTEQCPQFWPDSQSFPAGDGSVQIGPVTDSYGSGMELAGWR
jgi:cytochrome oxidase Cu insertion factor (SCO1/SenC/PrrC family)